MDRDELAFTYFPDNYRWSHGFLLALGAAPWAGGEILRVLDLIRALKGA